MLGKHKEKPVICWSAEYSKSSVLFSVYLGIYIRCIWIKAVLKDTCNFEYKTSI